MMNRIEYLETLTEQIRNKHAKKLVREEITAHIEDQKEAYLLSGKNEEEAEKLAILEMGNPVDAGMLLDKVHRPKTDLFMFVAMAFLTFIGIFTQSLTFLQAANSYDAASVYRMQTILYNLAGFALMTLISFVDYRMIGKYVRTLYAAFLMASVLGLIMPHADYRQAYGIGQMVCMLFVPLFAAFCYDFRGQRAKGICKALGLLLFMMLFIIILGYYASATMFLSFMTCLVTLCAASFKGIFGGRKKLQTGILLSGILGIPALFIGDALLSGGRFLFLADYQIMRIQAFLNPRIANQSYYTTLIRGQLSKASLLGRGDVGTLGEIPGAWSDYVLTCLTTYFGLFAAIVVVLIVAAYFLRSLRISLMQSNRLGFLLGISCSLFLILKSVIYAAMNFGIAPVIGIDMPFLTFGLRCTILNSLFVGIILSVYRHTNLLPELKEMPKRLHLSLTLK